MIERGDTGEATGALWWPSANFGARRETEHPSLIVLHYTAMVSADVALERLCDPAWSVSAHYLIGRDGKLWQLVHESARAWHAGAGTWGPVRDVNSASLGIEIDNDGRSPFSEPAMTRLEALIHELSARWNISPSCVIGHSDCAPGRKVDPGPRFDWRRLECRGLAARAQPGPDGGASLDQLLNSAGYTADAPVSDRLSAFRLRHRRHATGPANAQDRVLLAGLAAIDGGNGAA
ncbi:MAG: N-acetylmuramoyl-L-alanine amidase [Pseudomonadota bacterium]